MSAFFALLSTDADDHGGRDAALRAASASRHASLREARVAGATGFLGVAPAALRSEASGIQVIADARLDRREDLLSALGDQAPPASASDAALILAAYRRWATGCAERLLGDFSFIVWDGPRRRLFAARDPLGVRPFHFAQFGDRIVLGSEIEPLLNHPGISRELDLTTLGDFLVGTDSAPDGTFFQNVRKLPPGHSLTVDEAQIRQQRFWDVPTGRSTVYARDEDYAEHFLAVFQESVRDRLRINSQVVGVALSGGLDSSCVAASAQRSLDPGRQLLACSFIFPTLLTCDEQTYIRSVVSDLGVESVLIDAEKLWLLGDPAEFQPGLEGPALAWESGFCEMLRLLQARGGRLLLTGHGGDHLLRGSTRVYADRARAGDLGSVVEVFRHLRPGRRTWRILYRYLAEPLLSPRANLAVRRWTRRGLPHPTVPFWIHPEFTRRIGLAERLQEAWQSRRARSARQEIHDDLIVRPSHWRSAEWYHRMAAPWDVEVRHPFLDRRLFELVLTIPPRELFRLGTYKPLLRQAARRLVPEAVWSRSDKTRLGAFIDDSLRHKAAAGIEGLFEKPISGVMGFVDPEALRQAFRRYRDGADNESLRTLWYSVSLEIWLRRHADLLPSPAWMGSERAA